MPAKPVKTRPVKQAAKQATSAPRVTESYEEPEAAPAAVSAPTTTKPKAKSVLGKKVCN